MRNMKRVMVLPFEEIEGAFVCVSFKNGKNSFGEQQAEPHMTLVYVNGKVAAEWEPQYGPIQLWYERDSEQPETDAMTHWLWPYGSKPNLRFSQLAVDQHFLPESLVRGDYEHVFAVLKEWASREWEAPAQPESEAA